MKLFRNAALALTALTFVATSSALAANTTKKAVKADPQEFIYEQEEISTKRLMPLDAINGMTRSKTKRLIQIRWDFIEKILDSSRSI